MNDTRNKAQRHRHGQAWQRPTLPEQRPTWRGWPWLLLLAAWGVLLWLVLR